MSNLRRAVLAQPRLAGAQSLQGIGCESPVLGAVGDSMHRLHGFRRNRASLARPAWAAILSGKQLGPATFWQPVCDYHSQSSL